MLGHYSDRRRGDPVKLPIRKNATSKCNAFAVVKSDAYGHGAVRVAQYLEEDADAFAVATIEEALELRRRIKKPIMLLEGVFEPSEWELCADQGFGLPLKIPCS